MQITNEIFQMPANMTNGMPPVGMSSTEMPWSPPRGTPEFMGPEIVMEASDVIQWILTIAKEVS